MDLTLSSRGDYVVRAAIALASVWAEDHPYLKIREISDEMGVPRTYTPQILGLLARSGLAESKAGPAGGYRLRRDPGGVSILEVIEAAEGPLASRSCPMRGGPCRWDDVCAVHPTWLKASEAIRSVLATTSLAEVAAVDQNLERGTRVALPPPGHRRARPRRRTG